MTVVPPRVESVLAIAAHPDDIESWCGGTLALMAGAGTRVRLLLVTSGDKGSQDPDAIPERIGAQREAEALDAAAHLGLAGVTFLRYPDGEVEDTRALRRDLVEAIRRWRPDLVFTHDPEHPIPPYLTHRDHRVVGRAALDAIYPLARDALSFSELGDRGLTPHKVGGIWLFASSIADVYVDISERFDRKIAARLAHGSQTTDPAALASGWRTRAADVGDPVGLALAESFTVLSLD